MAESPVSVFTIRRIVLLDPATGKENVPGVSVRLRAGELTAERPLLLSPPVIADLTQLADFLHSCALSVEWSEGDLDQIAENLVVREEFAPEIGVGLSIEDFEVDRLHWQIWTPDGKGLRISIVLTVDEMKDMANQIADDFALTRAF